jgi:uncharacterized membrane protein
MFHALSLAIGAIGVAVILWGALRGFLGLLNAEYARFTGKSAAEGRESLPHDLGYYLLLGLEFLVAADIVHTVLTPTLHELAVLGAIVAIRTVISFSLTWELKEAYRKPDHTRPTEIPTR